MTHARLLLPAVVPMVVLLADCSGEGGAAADVVRRDSAGVEIVTSPAADRPLDWTFEHVFALGGEDDGPASFSSVGIFNMDTDAAGNLYVMDGQAHRVVVFAPDGVHLRTMGREGEGPGELQFPIGLAVGPSGTAEVFDIGKRGLVRFGPDGAPLEQEAFPYSTEPGVRRFYEVLEDRTIVAQGFGGGGGNTTGRDLALLAVPPAGSPAGALSDTIRYAEMALPTPEIVMFDCVGLALQPFFTPLLQWDARDGRVAITRADAYRVDLHELDGALLRSLRRAIPPVSATRADAEAEAGPGMRMMSGAGQCEITAEELVEGRGFLDVLPAIADVRLSPTGELWVERFEPGAGPEERSGPIDVFDATGAYMGTLPAGTQFPIAILPDDRIAISEKDEFDVERLVVLRIRRSSAEMP